MSMLAFWQAMKDRGRYWGYLFFIGIAIGVMSKGPVAGVLITLPIVAWLSITGNWRLGWQRIPLFSGSLLFLGLAFPWFLLAESTTPGFLEYYIIGEHWERFTTSGWQGNRYGNTHSTYFGAIWVEWLKAAFPMSLILLAALFALIWRKKTAAISALSEDWSLYLILWVSMLLVFFSFSGNIITTYVLPSLPPTALLVAGLWKTKSSRMHTNKPTRKSIAVIAIAGLLIPVIYLAVVIFHMPKVANHNSEKFLIEKFNEIKNNDQVRLIYLYILPSSAEYYSHGKTEVIHSTAEIRKIVNQEQSVYFAVPADYLSDITNNIEPCLNKIDRFGRYLLYSGNHKGCSN
jgi:4-amino-4-deoxy-L-arabinose transferase-like glycosyltransferase